MSSSVSNHIETVIAALRERDLPVKKEVIESAFADDADAVENSRWVEGHLNWETLLSKDEYTQYMKLENSGSWKHVLQNPALEGTRPLLDTDIQSAITALQSSTATIQKQTETLQLQCEALEKQSRAGNERRARRTRHLDQLSKKHGNARQHLNVATAELVQKIDQTVKDESELVTAGGKRILANTTAKLKQDDKILAHLESLVAGSESTSDDASIVRRVEDLTATLSQLISEEIHCRLDRLYLEGMQTTNADSNASTGDDHEMYNGLQAELESLYPEIGVLAEMSVKQQFGDPILRQVQQRRDQSHNATQKNLEDTLDAMTGMTTDMQMLSRQLRARQSFCEALRALIALYQMEAATQSTSVHPSRRHAQRRSMPGPLAVPTAAQPASQALDSLLRRLGSSSKAVFQSSSQDSGGAHALYEKRTQLAELLRNLVTAAEPSLDAYLSPTDRAMQQLSAALFGDSHFETSLTDLEQEGRLAALEAQLKVLQKGVEGLDVEAVYQRDKGRERFLDRWS